MKKLFIILLTFISIQSFGQSTSPTGYTRFYSKSSGDYWNINAGNIVTKDTSAAPIGVGEVRLKTSDSTVYIALSTTAAKKWYAIKGATATGAGTGSVTSVGLVATGALGTTGSPVTSSGNITLGWQGTSSDVVFGDGSYSNFTNSVTGVTDSRYSTLGHTHTFSQITDGPTAVKNLFSATAPLNYNPSTGVFSMSGGAVADGLESGGVVTWSGTGLVFDVTAATYFIGGSTYTSSSSQVTLDAADGSYGRYDAIIVTNSGTVSKITGTASGSPVFPQIDPASEILLTYVFIDAGATTPTQVSNEVIYDENVEWAHSTSGSVTANFANGFVAEQGSKSLSAAWTSTSNLIFTNGSTLSSGNYSTISFYIRLSNIMTNNTNVSIQFYNGANAVSNSVTASFSKTTTGVWQLISFNVPQFSFTSTSFNSVRLILTGSTSTAAGASTVYFDNIRLQAGITPPPTVQGLQSAYTKVTDGTTIAAASGSDQLKFRSADNKLSIAVANNDATHGDNVLFTINQGNLSLSSIGGSLNVSQINATGTPDNTTYLRGDGTWATAGSSTPGIDDVLAVGQNLTANRTISSSLFYHLDIAPLGGVRLNVNGFSSANNCTVDMTSGNVMSITGQGNTSNKGAISLTGNSSGSGAYVFIKGESASSIHTIKVADDGITFEPFVISTLTMFIKGLPTYADEAAATTGGLTTGQIYKTSTGELRIKL